jgi:Tfp pilus assembly protein PilO
MPKKLKRSDLLIILVMVALIGGVGYWVFYNSTAIAKVTTAWRDQEAELTRIKQKVAGLKQLQEEVTVNEAEMQRLAVYIPDREGQAEFILELDDLTHSSGVRVKSCKVSDRPTSFPDLPEYLVYQWDVTLESGYRQLLRFLESLPSQPRSTLLSKLNIASAGPGEDDQTFDKYILNVQLTLDLIATTGQKQKKVVQ